MTIEREVTIAGQTYPVILSDENELFRLRKQPGELLLAYGGKMRKNSRPTIHFAFTLLQTLKTPMKHSWNASSAAIWLSRGSSRKPTASSFVNFPGTIRWNRHPLRMPTELSPTGTNARNTGNTSTALPSAVCGRWNAARTGCWLERRG